MRVGSIFGDLIMVIYDDKNNNPQLYSAYCVPGTVLIALHVFIGYLNCVRWLRLLSFINETDTECKLLATDHITSMINYTVSVFSGLFWNK